MIALYIILGIVLGFIVLAICVIALTLTIVYYNPSLFIHKFMRKPVDKKTVIDTLKYPENFSQYLEKSVYEADISYGEKPNSLFDFYYPANNSSEKLPLIIWIHGGAFCAGEKEGTYALMRMLASEKFALASLNYELALEANFFSMNSQIHSFMEYLHSDLSKISAKVDLNRIIFAGDSAGGHIALAYVLSQFNKEYALKIGCECKYKESIKGLLLLCNPYDLRRLAFVKNKKLQYFVKAFGRKYFDSPKWLNDGKGRLTSFSEFIEDDFVPCFLTDGNVGSFEIQSRKFGQTLDEHNIKHVDLYWGKEKKINHEYNFELDTKEAMVCYETMLSFIKDITR